MQMHNGFRWVYASLGLWLIASPFLLFGGQASLMNARIVETAVLMLSGLAAFWVACLNLPRERRFQELAGPIVGFSMIMAPEFLDLSESAVAVWSLRMIGSIFVLSASAAIWEHQSAGWHR